MRRGEQLMYHEWRGENRGEMRGQGEKIELLKRYVRGEMKRRGEEIRDTEINGKEE